MKKNLIRHYHKKNIIKTRSIVIQPQTPIVKPTHSQIYLQKNKIKYFNKTGFVFKGVSKGRINLELYFLELDPEISYSVSLAKEVFNDGYLIGNSLFKIISVKRKRLLLQVEQIE